MLIFPDTDSIGESDFDCRVDKKGSKIFPCTDADLYPHYLDMQSDITFMTLRDEDGYDTALGKLGLAPDWVELGDYNVTHDFALRVTRKYKYEFSGYPVEKRDMYVPNPKDLVTKGLGSIPELRESMQATYLEIATGFYIGGNPMDAAEAFSTPVFLLMQAVENMAQAKALGVEEKKIEDKEREERRKNFIVFIISMVFLVR